VANIISVNFVIIIKGLSAFISVFPLFYSISCECNIISFFMKTKVKLLAAYASGSEASTRRSDRNLCTCSVLTETSTGVCVFSY
jgi:hypothetical protein